MTFSTLENECSHRERVLIEVCAAEGCGALTKDETETIQLERDLQKSKDEATVYAQSTLRYKNERAELVEALTFYADPETYFAIAFMADPPCGPFVDDLDETELGDKPGKRARYVLASTTETS